MIGKTHTKGQRVTLDLYGHPMTGTKGTIMSDYGLHNHRIQGIPPFWGYFVRLDNGEFVGASRHILKLAEPAPMPKINRGDLDKKVGWKDCAWQPQGL